MTERGWDVVPIILHQNDPVELQLCWMKGDQASITTTRTIANSNTASHLSSCLTQTAAHAYKVFASP